MNAVVEQARQSAGCHEFPRNPASMGALHRYFGSCSGVESDRGPLKPASCSVSSRCCSRSRARTSAGTPARFAIPSQNLADALDRFGEQSGLQVVYDHGS